MVKIWQRHVSHELSGKSSRERGKHLCNDCISTAPAPVAILDCGSPRIMTAMGGENVHLLPPLNATWTAFPPFHKHEPRPELLGSEALGVCATWKPAEANNQILRTLGRGISDSAPQENSEHTPLHLDKGDFKTSKESTCATSLGCNVCGRGRKLNHWVLVDLQDAPRFPLSTTPPLSIPFFLLRCFCSEI